MLMISIGCCLRYWWIDSRWWRGAIVCTPQPRAGGCESAAYRTASFPRDGQTLRPSWIRTRTWLPGIPSSTNSLHI